ncbi:hypothetical protein BJX70DRAFT_398399 [Aspergillus crustosus]
MFADSRSGFDFHNRPGQGSSSFNDEPLLFLYPRLFSVSARQQKRVVNKGVSASRATPTLRSSRERLPLARAREQTATRSQTRPRSRTRITSFKSLNRKRLASKLDETATSTTSAALPAEVKTWTMDKEEQAESFGVDGKFDAFAGLDGEGGLRREKSSPRARMWGFVARKRRSAARTRVFLTIGGVTRGSKSIIEKDSLRAHEQDGQERSREQDTVQGTPPDDKPVQGKPNQSPHLTIMQQKKIRRRESHLMTMQSKDRHSICRTLKDLLERAERQGEARGASPMAWSANPSDMVQREVLVPDETIAALAGVSETYSEHENIFFVRLYNGCRLQVLSASKSEGHLRKIIIWGSDQATKTVEKRIKRTQELQDTGDPLLDIQKPPIPVFPSQQALARRGIPTPLVRGVWVSKSRGQPPASLDAIFDQLESVSTIREFLEKTQELAKIRDKLPKDVFYVLWRLFTNEGQQHLVSTAALNTAISYLLGRGRLEDAGRLLSRAAHVATVDTCNIYLSKLAQRQQLIQFGHVLKRMILQRIQPNVDTWIAFLDCLISSSSKAKVIDLMKKKGYLDNPYAARRVLYSTIQEVFLAHLKQGKSVDEFLERISMSTGKLNWFTGPLIKHMFIVTVQLEDVTATDRLLKFCKENRLFFTSQAVGPLISLHKHNTFAALDYVFQCLDADTSLPWEIYEQLFFHAYRGQHYNICRVLWRYACMQRRTTDPIRNKVLFHLSQNTAPSKQTLSPEQICWHICVSKVIVGVDLHLPDYPAKDDFLRNIPKEFHDTPVGCLIKPGHINGRERDEQRIAARAILRRDVEIGSWYRPLYPLTHMLEAAAELDAQWQGTPRTTQWLVQNAIEVPVTLHALW